MLGAVQTMMPSVEKDRQITDLLTIMDLIVKGETGLVAARQPPSPQRLEFRGRWPRSRIVSRVTPTSLSSPPRGLAANLKGTDATFSELLSKVAAEIGTRKISPDMLQASEQLDAKEPAKALPFEESALKNLKELQAMLNSWRVSRRRNCRTTLWPS